MSSSWILECDSQVQWSLSGPDMLDSQVVNLRPHPTGRRWAGSQPSCQLSESGGGSRQKERGEYGEVVVEEVDQEYLMEHYTSANRKAKPGRPDDGLPWH